MRVDLMEKKNFLLLAIGLGVIGVIIGAISIFSKYQTLVNP